MPPTVPKVEVGKGFLTHGNLQKFPMWNLGTELRDGVFPLKNWESWFEKVIRSGAWMQKESRPTERNSPTTLGNG